MLRILRVGVRNGNAVLVNKVYRSSFYSGTAFKAGFEKLPLALKQISPPAIAAVISAGIAFLLTSYGVTKEIAKDSGIDVTVLNFLPSKIKGSEVATIQYDIIKKRDLYVERPSLLKQITDIINRKDGTGQYFIIYGAKGIGKSTIAERAAKDKKGILMIRITTAFSRDDVMKQLMKVTNTAPLDPETVNFIDALTEGKSSDGILPTIMIEIDRAGSLDQNLGIQAARGIAKYLSAACNIVIILSEANAVLEFGKDCDRENFIFVGELSESEAREYILKLELKLSDEEMKHVMDNIGTSPATLRRMQQWIHGGRSVKDFVVEKLASAELDLVKFPHKAILKALKEHPEGVSPKYFNNMENKGVDLSNPFAVGVAMNQSNAVVYRIELGRYMTISRCHETALRSYEPILPK